MLQTSLYSKSKETKKNLLRRKNADRKKNGVYLCKKNLTVQSFPVPPLRMETALKFCLSSLARTTQNFRGSITGGGGGSETVNSKRAMNSQKYLRARVEYTD